MATMTQHADPAGAWQPMRPLPQPPTDARLQLHHAVQFATALGISYLPAESDDSHTNQGWDRTLSSLVSRHVRTGGHDIAIAVRPADLVLLVLAGGASASTIPLHHRTIDEVATAVRRSLSEHGLDGSRYTLARHYDLPAHPVAAGAPFDAAVLEPFAFLGTWLANASLELERIAASTPGASEVRLWPHHLDIATLITVAPDRSTSAGFALGDASYTEPYLYVNARPQPDPAVLTAALEGGGQWHTEGWVGAVLPVSRVTATAAGQQPQVRAFLASALAACRDLVSR